MRTLQIDRPIPPSLAAPYAAVDPAVIAVDYRIPCGFQLGMPMHLDRAMAEVEKLFVEHTLPLREELISELTLWRKHAEDGLRFAHQCGQLMRVVIRTVGDTVKRR